MHEHVADMEVERTIWTVPRRHRPARINCMESTESHLSLSGIFSQDTLTVELLCEIQLRMDNTRNQTRRIRRSDHLHVDVQ